VVNNIYLTIYTIAGVTWVWYPTHCELSLDTTSHRGWDGQE